MAKIRRNMRRATTLITDGVEDGLVEVAGEIMEHAVTIAPVLTGKLVRSAYLTVAPRRKTLGPRINVGFRVHYALIVEARLGFLQKAVDAKVGGAIMILRNSAAKRLILGLRSK